MSTNPALSVSFGGYSTAGIKEKNQDAFAAFQGEESARIYKGAVAAIADGVSSSDRSEEASQLAVTHFITDYYSTPETWSVRESAARILNAMNSWLYRDSGPGTARDALVSTFSCAIIKSTTGHLFHVGDSRIYHYRDGHLDQLTQDHSIRGAEGRWLLTRALGLEMRLQVDYIAVDLARDDIILLTTDGVHDFVNQKELCAGLNDQDQSLELRAEHLVQQALQNGADDNLSCLLVRVDELPLEDIDEAHRKLIQYVIPPVLQADNSIDGFVVLRTLYSGTRSHLYLVERQTDKRQLVLKAPSRNFAEDPQYLEAFVREQWIGLRIRHPGVMQVFPRPPESHFMYNLFEYIDAGNLRQWMHDNPKPDIEMVRQIAEQIAAALRALQRLSMVHRDLNPENVLIDANRRIKLIDFGTVQVSGLQELESPIKEEYPVGSMHYIAPEYLLRQPGMHRSDIFSLGVLIYEMLSGHVPYKSTPESLVRHRKFQDWRYCPLLKYRQDLPPWVDLCLRKATAPSPANRYPVLSEFMQDLRTPNQAMLNQYDQAPLLERNPIRFWQILCAVLALLLLMQSLLQ